MSTGAARRISGQNRHDRLALVGPDDEIKELSVTFDAMLVSLERSFDANRRFAANASHELRTPLALQHTSLEIPLAEGRVPDDLKPSIERSLRATAQREAGRHPAAARQGPTGPAELPGHRPRGPGRRRGRPVPRPGRRRGHHRHHRAGPRPTSGDPVLLGQVAANLVQNAVRHNVLDRGVEARVSMGRVAGGAELRVDNTGPSVGPAEIEHLFEPFHRGEGARLSTGRPGSGPGLSVVRAVVESHGGTVVAEARADGGLSVTVFLPENSGGG